MAKVHELSRTDARRIAVRAQLLTKQRPTDLVETVRQLTLVQIEPTNGKPRRSQREPGAWCRENGVTPPPGSFENSTPAAAAI